MVLAEVVKITGRTGIYGEVMQVMCKIMDGQMKLIKLGFKEDGTPASAKASLKPARNLNLGRGRGNTVNTELSGGVVGIILDGRRRPFELPEDAKTRVAKLKEWMLELDIYSKERLQEM